MKIICIKQKIIVLKNEQKDYPNFLDHTFQLPTNSKLASKYKLPKPHQTMETFHGFAFYKKINQTKQFKIVSNKKTQNTIFQSTSLIASFDRMFSSQHLQTP
jgi:hypothetical protein